MFKRYSSPLNCSTEAGCSNSWIFGNSVAYDYVALLMMSW